jgi:hypothetical protein
MAITIHSSVNPTVSPTENQGQPSALLQVGSVNVTLDASYAAGGYDLSASLSGAVIQPSPFMQSWDGAALYHLRVEDDSGTPKLLVYDDDNGAPGTETSTADQSGHATVDVMFFYK